MDMILPSTRRDAHIPYTPNVHLDGQQVEPDLWDRLFSLRPDLHRETVSKVSRVEIESLHTQTRMMAFSV